MIILHRYDIFDPRETPISRAKRLFENVYTDLYAKQIQDYEDARIIKE